jgi:hypothetical protein
MPAPVIIIIHVIADNLVCFREAGKFVPAVTIIF